MAAVACLLPRILGMTVSGSLGVQYGFQSCPSLATPYIRISSVCLAGGHFVVTLGDFVFVPSLALPLYLNLCVSGLELLQLVYFLVISR